MAERNTVSVTEILNSWQDPHLVEHIVNAKPLEDLLSRLYWHDSLLKEDLKQEESGPASVNLLAQNLLS